jgi:2,3-bisphosphoglycerate-dependent phosphoglycerate mutase
MYKIVLIRHGESLWNKENRFTGWVDVDLSLQGVSEAHVAGKVLKQEGFSFDLAFESVLKRVTHTLEIVLDELSEKNIEVRKSWKLNERHYGSLQGLNKSEMATKYGEDQVKIWRRGYDVAVPPLSKNSPMYPGSDPLYADLNESEIPLSENLKNVVERVVPYWNDEIIPEMKKGRKIIVAASGNSLRAIVKYVEKISDNDIVNFNFPTGIPMVYEFDENLNLVSKAFIGDPEVVKRAMEKVANQGKAK